MEAVVEAHALAKTFSGSNTLAVDGIDFHVRAGECFGFLGPNGAGKTTTMRMISCRTQRSGGELRVMGLDPATHERDVKRRIGVVPQETNLDTVLSVEENLVSYARYFDMPRPQAATRAAEALHFVQLADRAGRHIDALSGGMKRRLLVARALMNEPQLLVLDEPTTGLDPQARHLVWEKLRELRRTGVTLIITTHYMEEAAQLCDRLVIMHQGKILVEGSPPALIRDHLPPQVIELTARTPTALKRLAAKVKKMADGFEIAGDRIILHTSRGESLLKKVERSGASFEQATHRPSSLEDLFLKLTGRRLEE